MLTDEREKGTGYEEGCQWEGVLGGRERCEHEREKGRCESPDSETGVVGREVAARQAREPKRLRVVQNPR
jgi:hypothetical protein